MDEPKTTIHEFDPVIYPRKVWIAVGKCQFKDRFSEVSEWDETCNAVVDCVHDEERNLGGMLIRFESVDAITFGNVTHESSHVAMEIFDYIGATVEIKNQEPFCYLAGWIGKCCEEVKRIESEKLKENEE